jgi:hypothetical protein
LLDGAHRWQAAGVRRSPHLLLLLVLLSSGCLSTVGTRTRALLSPASGERAAYAGELVAAARARGLAHHQQWLRLGHWRSTWLGGVESEAEGDNFFLSPRGRRDPAAELEATLRGFLAELAPYDAKDAANRGVQHPLCQFPARYLFLSRELGIDATRLPSPDCSRYREFVALLRPRAAAVVFSSYYLNNPSSAFGHTFLRILKDDAVVSEDKRQLLDFGIDYSASVDTTFAPVYAVKGIFGLFPGVFGKVPFYFKVREYNDFESRDLWEYGLRLDARQLEMLVAHLWELGSTWFRYYYLTANCSYQILALIEAAVPGLSLLEELHTPVLPVDTVRVLGRQPGLITGVRFRPSLRTQFRSRLRGLGEGEREAVSELRSDPERRLLAFSEPTRIRILDAAQDLVDLRFARELLTPDPEGKPEKLKQRLLERRAELLVRSEEPAPLTPWRTMPLLGHATRRLSLGAGADDGGGGWLELGARLAMHDLADPPRGYPELAELEFLPFRARWDLARDAFRIEQLDLVHVRSLSGQDRFDRKISWEARLGSERRDEACDCLAFHLQVGGGAALTWLDDALALFAFVQSHAWIAGPLDGIRGSPFGFGLGPSAGLRARLSRGVVTLATAEWLWLPDQGPSTRLVADLTLRIQLWRQLALDLTGTLRDGRLAATGSTLLYF